MKSQIIDDFLEEFTVSAKEVMKELNTSSEWKLFIDGSSNTRGSKVGILLKNSKGDLLEHSLRFSFQASNNKAEYEALIAV